MTGAQLIMACLKAHRVTTLFGYPGGAIMPTYDALYDAGLDHLLCRNEQGTAMAAIGYARSTGKVGVCIATSGPGATNLVTGLGDAMMDSIPVVAITGLVASPLIGTDAFQEADVLGLSLACTKHSFIVQSADVALQGDLIQALNALKQDRDIEPWREQIRNFKAKLDFTYVENQGNRPIDPWALLNSLSNRKPNNAIICTDVGQHQMWLVQHILRVARHCGFTVTTMEMTLIETQVRLKITVKSDRTLDLLVNQLVKLPDVLMVN
ncbi:thiamine pyrophosphate-binding protein [Haemophilus influenzae]|uniref:thiamine pyrophosphate-binding protein n=1 Tax=Haemophilus influenzae TaxID=727 RepID=UPI0006670DFF